jgi:hypothetical protein
MTGTTDSKRVVGRISNPSARKTDGLEIRPPTPGGRWLVGVLVASALAAALAFCHGCHGDVDDELFAPTNTSAGK